MDSRSRIAWNLRRLRVARNLSQEHLAVDAAIDRTYVGGIERQVFNPTVDLLDRLAAALGVDAIEFFRIPEPGEPLPKPLPRGRRSKAG